MLFVFAVCHLNANFILVFKMFERAERLREIDGFLLPSFVRLQELVTIMF